VPVAGCALAAALLAGSIRPGTQLGLGAVLVAGVVWVAAALALRSRGAYGIEQRLLLALALLLAAAPLLRDADWVIVPDLGAAFCLAAAAAPPARTWAALRRAVGRALAGLAAAWPALVAPLAPVIARGRSRAAVSVLRGMALGAVLLAIFGALFVSADAAFAEVVNRALVPDWSFGAFPARLAAFALAGGVGGALALNASTPATVAGARHAAGRLRPAEWVTALALLDALFAAFVAVQIAVLFGGHDHVLRTAGLTYAEYARQGFGEMIVAASLTLAVAALALRHTAREGLRQERLLHVLLGLLFAFTLVVLASALRRLGLYEDAFGFTRTRLLAHGAILWLGALLLLVSGCALIGRPERLPGAAVLMTGGALALFTALNPEGIIAARNVDRFAATGRLDTAYLSQLSADAVPALTGLPAGVRGCVLGARGPIAGAGDGWAAANLSRARARKLLRRTPATPCTR
jgi:hypothetical protein